MKPLFTGDDFICIVGPKENFSGMIVNRDLANTMADIANRIFQEWLAKGTVVCSGGGLSYEGQCPTEKSWSKLYPQSKNRGATHKALLINIEPLEVPDSAKRILEDLTNSKADILKLFELESRARKLTQNKGGGK